MFRGDHQRRLLHQVFKLSAFFPAAIDAAVPVEAAAETGSLEGADKNFKIFFGQELAMRPVRQAIEEAAARRAENSRGSALVERPHKVFGGLIETAQRTANVALELGLGYTRLL